MKKKLCPEFTYDAETRTTICQVKDGNLVFKGKAVCAPEDADMESVRTGQRIAEMRAEIRYLKYVKRDLVQPQLQTLNQYYHSIKSSKKFNPKGYCEKALFRQMTFLKNDILFLDEAIKDTSNSLAKLISEKDSFYKEIRLFRERGQRARTELIN